MRSRPASNLVLPDDTASTNDFVRDLATSMTIRLATNVAHTDRLETSGDGRCVVRGVAHPDAPIRQLALQGSMRVARWPSRAATE
jgi:hypothetical protein